MKNKIFFILVSVTILATAALLLRSLINLRCETWTVVLAPGCIARFP